MPRLPPPTRERRVIAWRAVLLTAAVVLLGLAAMTRSWALLAVATAPGAAGLLIDPPSLLRRGGF